MCISLKGLLVFAVSVLLDQIKSGYYSDFWFARKQPSSNMNEVIRAVLKKIFHTPKGQKAQKRNQAKAQNANKRTKIKNTLKKYLSGKK